MTVRGDVTEVFKLPGVDLDFTVQETSEGVIERFRPASDAARVASLQQSAGAARAQAQAAATDTVSGENLNCKDGPQVDIEFLPSGEFERGATVHVEVTCTVDTRDLTFIGLPLSVTLFEEAWEPIDAHRSL
jgi:hypothetical protein